MELIILDRDGVINEDSDDYIKSPLEWQPIPGSIQAIARLNHAGYRVVVVTNQSGIGRGLFDIETLGKIHEKMCLHLEEAGASVESIFYCPHTPDDHCDCRKPKTGLFLDIETRLGKSLDGVYSVGDSLRDLEASVAVGATPVLVKTGKGMRTLESQSPILEHTLQFNDLYSFVDKLLSGKLSAS
ncbi:MAG: D-glycero-beta-D-manno-heptose 1,7-bisphosphate 7-phosphatase [Gammaproteobacteria bacterium]|nr:D-glycero-beta-D-manno-heptose 1,7-bisphosphate 7-phosphatase [Gammaproteobacteria bacterium]MBT3490436.1 D-glycero-beta-D-manno-heptose 1,7-bisphosphate 7-phosphatase [Gammaproteobacteria bacterium]MBT3718908.1 D-glycero-beta-D-manno-heptose 1,7-bisphosphate 7-phosphatase [Gammaproteobacteria bacterium]MBT3845245.1 D-glycero-beta-D-manno-heptose 1,7-bisphosphate 7-phosphatase [Gammaproteobacteria bacterium]MBT3893908.1 D-glycero-beta-D-manno-heptose 1,7-bisphosphate 7-phosphatase [Gammaprot